MIKKIEYIAVLCCSFAYIQLQSASPKQPESFVFPTIPVKFDTSTPIRIEPGPIQLDLSDFRKVGADLGAGMGDFFSMGARSFADVTNNREYADDLSRGMSGAARSMGGAIGDFNKEAQQNLFPEMATSFRGFVGSAINKRNSFQFGGLIALSIAITVTGYYLTKFIWEVIIHKVLNPAPIILLPETKYGRWDRFKRWWKCYQTPAMIFNESVKERLEEIEAKAKTIRAHNKNRKNRHKKINYDNLLLHGKPGTGKTLFARILADRTDMDFAATTAASLLQSGTAGIKYFNDIMAMARRSSYGLILFIDEADALFVDRDTLNPDSDHYKILSHILAVTGDGNSNFMLIAATNHAYIMDDAMGRRFQDRILMPLPDEETRRELINLYSKKFLCNKQTHSKIFIEEVHNLLDTTKVDEIIQQTAGLSHAEIKDMIEAINKKAAASSHGMITITHITQAIDQAIEKHTAVEEDRNKKQQRFKTVYTEKGYA